METLQSAVYTLEDEAEAGRLEFQATLRAYQVGEEIADFPIRGGQRILDAGCGSGLLSRYLVNHFDEVQLEACDFSEVRLQQARRFSSAGKSGTVRYFRSALERIQRPNATYDAVISRYVFEHLSEPAVACDEIFRVLKPGGRALIIDFDGLIFDLYCRNAFVQEALAKIRGSYPFDMYMGRKLPSILSRSGFRRVHWKIQTFSFQDEDLHHEQELNKARFRQILPEFRKILGDANATRFAAEFIEEMGKPGSVLFYNKFIVSGEKGDE